MLYIIALVLVAVCSAGAFGSSLAYKKFAASGGSTAVAERNQTIETITEKLSGLSKFEESYATRPQFAFIKGELDDVKAAFAKQSQTLKEIEGSLSVAQKKVEEKETQQQELKTLKEEDETKLIDILTVFETLSQESMSLEQELAQSLKNVEEMLAGTTLSNEQRGILTEFNEALLSASSRLRDLVTEYQVVRERLEGLQGQFKDLEEEYTRLVEQQLGIS